MRMVPMRAASDEPFDRVADEVGIVGNVLDVARLLDERQSLERPAPLIVRIGPAAIAHGRGIDEAGTDGFERLAIRLHTKRALVGIERDAEPGEHEQRPFDRIRMCGEGLEEGGGDKSLAPVAETNPAPFAILQRVEAPFEFEHGLASPHGADRRIRHGRIATQVERVGIDGVARIELAPCDPLAAVGRDPALLLRAGGIGNGKQRKDNEHARGEDGADTFEHVHFSSMTRRKPVCGTPKPAA